MLKELSIRGFALIDQLELSFYSGFSVLTGETGAGKSIIIDAISLLLGARASSEMIRSGSEQAIVEGCFELTPYLQELLQEWNIAGDDDVILAREITTNGRSKCRINGRLATLAQFAELGPYLVDILGQHDHQSLLNVESHIGLLDAFGDNEFQKKKEVFYQLYQDYETVRTRRVKLAKNERERARRMDLLRYQIAEIAEAQLEIGEDGLLHDERTRLGNAERLQSVTTSIYTRLKETHEGYRGLLDSVAELVHELTAVLRFDSSLQPISDLFSGAVNQLEEGCRGLRHYIEETQADPRRLAIVEDRLQLIHELQRKYGETIYDVLAYFANTQQELEELLNSSQTMSGLEAQEHELLGRLQELGQLLSEARREMAEVLKQKIEQQLALLNMDKTTFCVEILALETLTPTGADKVEFKLSANVGEGLKPLAKIASGGEMSRIMLALKTILAQTDRPPTLIFDEVDAGIGGLTAPRVAAKLKELSQKFQVLAVTHLPVVASCADQHYFIEKQTEAKRTLLTVNELDEDCRIKELTRMLGGSDTEGITAAHAKELLKAGHTS